MEQRELVVRAGEGDHDAFAVLARAALVRLDAVARLILRDSELARDAVQEALVRAWRDLPGLREPERFDAWLHRLTVRACIDAARVHRRRVVEVELTPDIDEPVSDDSAVFADRDLIDQALGRLEPAQRVILVLRYYLDLTVPETADVLGIPVGTAKSRLNRSLEALRGAIAADSVSGSHLIAGERFA